MEKNIRGLNRIRTTRSRQGLDELARSIGEVGVLQPILIDPEGNVLAGARRLEAARAAGLKRIPVVISSRDESLQEIAKLDSNLMTLPLGKLEFDQALHRRKQLWEKMHPETRQYVAGGKSSRKSFTREVSGRLGVSKRTIEKAVARIERSSTEVNKARLKGLPASKADELSKLPRSAQKKLVALVEATPLPQVKRAVKIAEQSGPEAAVCFLKKKPTDLFITSVEDQTESLEKLLTQALRGQVQYDVVGPPGVLKKLLHLQNTILKFVDMHQPLESGAKVQLMRAA